MWKFQGSIKKEVEFLGVYKKKLCNFHDQVLVLDLGVSHNFAEFPWVKALWNFLG